MNWFEPKIVKEYVVIEIPKALPLEESADAISAVQSLRSHVGFNWLLRKLDLQAARLRSELINQHHSSIEEVAFLQSGIHWCDWLRQQLDLADSKSLNHRSATKPEAEFFQDLESTIELIGQPPQADISVSQGQ